MKHCQDLPASLYNKHHISLWLWVAHDQDYGYQWQTPLVAVPEHTTEDSTQAGSQWDELKTDLWILYRQQPEHFIFKFIDSISEKRNQKGDQMLLMRMDK